ncbi:MAG TPA: hypothetical protein VD968_19675 [Pyrinomonadaceae bacterium]|nr:hypothetical protein [Pyrinomonadaceae bacterium]
MRLARDGFRLFLAVLALAAAARVAGAQETPVILTGSQLLRVVPTGFYFEGQSAPTQLRNAAAARFGQSRHVIAGMVDTSGYSSEIRAKYEGFFITDSSVSVGGEGLSAGAYGFGFTDDGKFNLFDVGGRPVLTAPTTRDARLRRPRPLMMTRDGDAVRLYSGRSYVAITLR